MSYSHAGVVLYIGSLCWSNGSEVVRLDVVWELCWSSLSPVLESDVCLRGEICRGRKHCLGMTLRTCCGLPNGRCWAHRGARDADPARDRRGSGGAPRGRRPWRRAGGARTRRCSRLTAAAPPSLARALELLAALAAASGDRLPCLLLAAKEDLGMAPVRSKRN